MLLSGETCLLTLLQFVEGGISLSGDNCSVVVNEIYELLNEYSMQSPIQLFPQKNLKVLNGVITIFYIQYYIAEPSSS